MNNAVLEYLEGYFGGQLNESISDEDIMQALDDLLETANAVEDYLKEFIGIGPMASARMRGSALPRRKPGEKMRGMEKHGPKRKREKKPMSKEMIAFNRSQARGSNIPGMQ